jgi:hypothetical protein
MKFIITVDVEADNFWKRDTEVALDNIKYLPRFQAMCEKFGFRPTYLVSHEVAANPASVNIVKPWADANSAEIGAHPHVWTSPPITKDIDWEMKVHRFWHELDDGELENKLTTTTELISSAFGRKPTSFRAGRWCLDGRVLRILEKLGYLVDSSITPKVSWQRLKGDPDKAGGTDYSHAPERPYHPAYDNVSRAGESKIWEIPITIIHTYKWAWRDSALENFMLKMEPGFIRGVINSLFFGQKWLRIYPNTYTDDLTEVLMAARRQKMPCINFMIHSSELMPGGSPYAKDEAGVERIYGILDETFAYYKEQGLEAATLSEFAINYK